MQSSIALETLQVFAPLAKLLGMYQIKVSLNENFHVELQIITNKFLSFILNVKFICISIFTTSFVCSFVKIQTVEHLFTILSNLDETVINIGNDFVLKGIGNGCGETCKFLITMVIQ